MICGAAILDLDLVASEIQLKNVFWLKFLIVNSKMTSSTSRVSLAYHKAEFIKHTKCRNKLVCLLISQLVY